MIDFHAWCENKLLCGFSAEKNIHEVEQQSTISFNFMSRNWRALTNFLFLFNDRKEKSTISFVTA